MDPATRAVLRADPRLSRFEPLSRIIYCDDFDEGYNGWLGLIGNYEGSLDSMLPGYAQYLQPMLSPVTMWDTGSHGSHDGTYCLKTATRARKGSQNVSLKRVTFRHPGPIQFEGYFCFKPEASDLQLSELDVRAVGVLFDLQDGEAGSRRVMPHIRYLNALDGTPMLRWQYKQAKAPFAKIGTSGKTVSHYHLAPEGWEDVPDGGQKLCYNEVPTKINWHYLKIGFDLRAMRFTALQCNDRSFDVSKMSPMVIPAMANLWCMLNLAVFVETDVDKRAFLFLDSVCLSGDF
jgi:hypothetical protein